MEPLYIYLRRRTGKTEKVATDAVVPDEVNIDYLSTGDAYGVEILNPTDVEFDGRSIIDIRGESLSRQRALAFTRQVSDRRMHKLTEVLRDLRAAQVELLQWQSTFGESALRDHLLEMSRLRARGQDAVVLPPDAALLVHSFLTGWLDDRDGTITHDQLHELSTALVAALEEENAEVDAAPQGDATVWRLVVEFPAHVGVDKSEELFTLVADAAHTWEPEDRKNWDLCLSAHIVDPDSPVPSADEIEHARAVLAAVPGCAYVGPVTGVRCSVPVRRVGALCEDHTVAMVATTDRVHGEQG
jgi:hypothetical protein